MDKNISDEEDVNEKKSKSKGKSKGKKNDMITISGKTMSGSIVRVEIPKNATVRELSDSFSEQAMKRQQMFGTKNSTKKIEYNMVIDYGSQKNRIGEDDMNTPISEFGLENGSIVLLTAKLRKK